MNMLQQLRKSVRLRVTSEAPAQAKRDPKKTGVARIGQAIKSQGGGGDFEASPIDLSEIARAYYTDSYIRRAVDKHSALMFKNGWEISGKNDQAVEYVWTRLKLMAEATGQSIDSLLQEISDNMVLYGNSYVVKARAKKNGLPAGVTAIGYSGKQPIAGYFVLPPMNVTVSRDDNGKILAYEETAGAGGEGVTYKPEDIIHFPYRRPSGRAYGVPFIYNSLDDVKLLRQIEENVARLIHRNLFPLHLYKVGLTTPGFEATDEEIEELREEIRQLPMDGALVVPERHNIEVVGAQGQAIDANGYLKYFRERVFSGLGVSDTIMGVSGTANKSTSDNQSADLNDTVKDFQKVYTDIIKFSIINELLFEGGFDPVLNPDDEVEFIFHEIEFDAKIKRENHVVQMFMQNAITFEEMRQLLGFEVGADEGRLYNGMFAKATSSEGAAAQGNNQDQPENQAGKALSPGEPSTSEGGKRAGVSEKTKLTEGDQLVTLSESLDVGAFTETMEEKWRLAAKDARDRLESGQKPKIVTAFTTGLFEQTAKEQLRPFIEKSFLTGFQKGLSQIENAWIKLQPGDTQTAIGDVTRPFNRLMRDMEQAFKDSVDQENATAFIDHAFSANQYRIRFAAKRMAYEAYNYGVALSAERAKRESVYVAHKPNCCAQCMEAPGEIALVPGWRESIPPHHINCECIITLTNQGGLSA